MEDLEYQVGRLALGPDDVLVVKSQRPVTVETAAHIRRVAISVIGPDARVLVIDHDMDLSVLTRAEIEARS